MGISTSDELGLLPPTLAAELGYNRVRLQAGEGTM